MNDLASAQHLLTQKRSAIERQRPPIQPSPDPQSLADLATSYQPPAPSPQPPAPSSYRPITFEEARSTFNLPTLGQLTTNHLNRQQANQLTELLISVRSWRTQADQRPGLSYAILSPDVGIGKTHIAESVAASYASITGDLAYENDAPLFTLEQTARLYTARELINLLGGEHAQPLSQIAPPHIRCLVIDDLGREGYLDYVKASEQQKEKQARYFHLIDHIYKRRQGRSPVSLFITSNLLANQLTDLLGEAVWDRLLQLAPRGYITELTGLPSYRRLASGRIL